MIYKNVFMAVLFTAIAVFSQPLTISGKVTDTSGVTPIAGAVVKLEKHGFTVTTGADGIFTLTGAVSIGSNSHQLQPNALSATMQSGMLTLYVAERGAVTISTFTPQGRMVSRVHSVLDKGTHRVAQPGLGHGVYLHRIVAGSRELVVKSSSFGSTGGSVALNTPTPVTANSSSRYVPIHDVIFASKEGLLNYRVMVTNPDTSGMVIKMIPNAGNVTDADGNVYQSVRIGNQVWTVENWRSTKYNDGTAIPHVTDSAAWEALTTPGYCYYNNATHADKIKKWGALYNWYVVSPTNLKKIAPAGWHVPTDAEWDTLQNYLITNGYNWDGTTYGNKIAKSMAAQTDWMSYATAGTIGNDLSKNNASGFSALPGGYRGYGGFFYLQSDTGFSALPGGDRFLKGNFYYQSSDGIWWSATAYVASLAYLCNLSHGGEHLVRSSSLKSWGFSVRLLRD